MSEQKLIAKLEKLTQESGFIYILSFLSIIDFYKLYGGDKDLDELEQLFGSKIKSEIFTEIKEDEKLIRNELAFVAGLMIKNEIKTKIPTKSKFKAIYEETRALLVKIHDQLQQPTKASFIKAIKDGKVAEGVSEPVLSGKGLREPLFYSAESAFEFQYREFSKIKYAADKQWLLKNLGFSIQDACEIAEIISSLIKDRLNAIALLFGDEEQFKQCSFALGQVEVSEIVELSNSSKTKVLKFFSSFSCKPGQANIHYNKIGDYNEYEAKPIIKLENGKYFILSPYILFQAIYESPFYWMLADKKYLNIATENRGKFLENFVANKLGLIFGESNVFQNVIISKKRGHTVTDIDVLVVFKSRALIFQTKSKRLTIASKLGNDNSLKDDFEKAIQSAYEQGLLCRKELLRQKFEFFDSNNNKIEFNEPIKEAFVICTLSDHFPNIGFQTRQFLLKKETDPFPLVTDIFMLDVFAEFLNDPFDFLFFLKQRIELFEKIIGDHEFNVLAYHLSQKLWVEEGVDIIYIHTSVGKELDQEFVNRRIGLVKNPKPFGILQAFKKGSIGKLISELKKIKQPAIVDVIFFIFLLSSEAANGMCKGIKDVTAKSMKQGRGSDFSFLVGDSGFTFMCDNITLEELRKKITIYSRLKKYKTKARFWVTFGKTHLGNKIIDGLLISEGPWKFNQELEDLAKTFLPTPKKIVKMTKQGFQSIKVGRNHPCPCGSGKKYKKCCGP